MECGWWLWREARCSAGTSSPLPSHLPTWNSGCSINTLFALSTPQERITKLHPPPPPPSRLNAAPLEAERPAKPEVRGVGGRWQ